MRELTLLERMGYAVRWRFWAALQWVDDRLELGCLIEDEEEPERVWCRDISCNRDHTMNEPHNHGPNRWPFPQLGDVWFDRRTEETYRFNGELWELIVPEESPHIQRIVMLLAKADITLEPRQLEMLRVYYKKAGTDGY